MIQDKVLKIIKGLNTFSQDDILFMSDFKETEISNIIAGFINDGTVIKTSGDTYSFVNKIPQRKQTLQLIEKSQIQIIPDNNITFRQATKYFMTNHVLQNCTPSTLKTYKSLIKQHLNPFFGKMEIKVINQKHIKDFIELKSKEGLANKRTNDCITLFGNMFKKLIEWELISESPYNGIINVKFNKQSVIKVLKKDEMDALLESTQAKYPKLYWFVLLISSTGIKKGEILALQKEDIDLKNRKININKTLFQGKIVYLKVKSAIRQVHIPENIAIEIETIIKNKKNGDFILFEESFSWFTQDRQLRIDFAKLLKELNMERITLVELRHTYAYNALQQGMSIDYLHKQLGDYSIQATMDKYRDFIPC